MAGAGGSIFGVLVSAALGFVVGEAFARRAPRSVAPSPPAPSPPPPPLPPAPDVTIPDNPRPVSACPFFDGPIPGTLPYAVGEHVPSEIGAWASAQLHWPMSTIIRDEVVVGGEVVPVVGRVECHPDDPADWSKGWHKGVTVYHVAP